MKSQFLIIALLTSLISCKKEYNCVCGNNGSEPYIYTINANNLEYAIMECSPLGSNCEIAEE